MVKPRLKCRPVMQRKKETCSTAGKRGRQNGRKEEIFIIF